MADEDDPVIASYDVCMTDPVSATPQSAPRLYVLQYPSHRPRAKPYTAARGQTPTALRLKSEAGFIELDVPILTHEHYNEINGERFGKAIVNSHTVQAGGSYGLAGGFGNGTNQPRLRDIPAHDRKHEPPTMLDIQTLGGKIPKHSPRDPIYLIGSLHQNRISLSHLDAVVQMRPQLHHIDAEDEFGQKRFQGGANALNRGQQHGTEAPIRRSSRKQSKSRSKTIRTTPGIAT